MEKSWSSYQPLRFEDLLPRLTFTWICFVRGTAPLVFNCDYCKSRRLSESYFLSSVCKGDTIFSCVD